MQGEDGGRFLTWTEWAEEPGVQMKWEILENGKVEITVLGDGASMKFTLAGFRAKRFATAMLAAQGDANG